ncbi:MAG: ABC transporter substrate-binding protein, partial [Alphaproteobacteria bacterium]
YEHALKKQQARFEDELAKRDAEMAAITARLDMLAADAHGRADAAPINRIQWLAVSKKVKGLAVLPKENDCQGSQEKAQPVGVAIDKGQDAWLAWLRAVAKEIQPRLTAEELAIANAD